MVNDHSRSVLSHAAYFLNLHMPAIDGYLLCVSLRRPPILMYHIQKRSAGTVLRSQIQSSVRLTPDVTHIGKLFVWNSASTVVYVHHIQIIQKLCICRRAFVNVCEIVIFECKIRMDWILLKVTLETVEPA